VRQDLLAAAAITAFGLWALAPGLDHPTIYDWDESFHQVVTRGTYDEPPVPRMYRDPLYPIDPMRWYEAGVWLHKPPGTAWFGAAMMKLIGVRTMALRLGSLVGELAAAVALYLLVKGLAGRAWALVAGLGFLALPSGWILAQGFFFGDVTDCTLVGWVTVSILLLVRGVERQSWRWMAAAGAAVGAAYLCKSMMSLVPVGVAGVLFAARSARLCDGPRWKELGAMYGAFALVALPWSFYANARWPDLARVSTKLALESITAEPGSILAIWRRPWDAILNEVNLWEIKPLPVISVVVAMLWLWRVALRTRDARAVALALWLTSTEVAHSVVAAKCPAHVWSAIPAALAGLALLGSELWRSRAAAFVAVGMLGTPWLIEHLPVLARLRESLPPAVFFQTRTGPGLFEGALAVGAGALLAWAAAPLFRRSRVPAVAMALVAGAWLLWALLWNTTATQLEMGRARLRKDGYVSYTQDLGQALDRVLPEKSVLWMPIDFDPPNQFERYNLMFWSGRTTYQLLPEVPLARARGDHSYLVSALSQPFQPVAGVPANAWLRAYDLEAPAPLPDLPEGVSHLTPVDTGALEVIGVAAGRASGDRDRWAFYARARGGRPPAELRVAFHLRDGPVETLIVPPEATLLPRWKLAGGAWFVLPALGPPHADVATLELGPARVAMPIPQASSAP
jgi:4-amino-4-deoxy-L-arabinose transferase-like glycosyltransferase